MNNELKEILTRHGFSFNKSFGQNFLTDKNLLASIARDAKAENENVLEIGPGAGALSKELCKIAKNVVAFEIDKKLEGVLAETMQGITNFKLIFKDALKAPLDEIESNFDGDYIVVANLPYYITTPLIFKFLPAKRVKRLTIMVQKEVAERIVAKEGTKQYGGLSVMCNFYASCKIERIVKRQMFTPEPNVDSAIITLERKEICEYEDVALFEKVVKCAFSNRRKTLANNLQSSFNLSKEVSKNILKECEIDENARGETLSISDFKNICHILKNLSKNS